MNTKDFVDKYGRKDKWRWEFMRHNKELREDFGKIIALRERAFKQVKKSRITGDWKKRYFKTPEYKQEREYCRKYEIRLPFFPDPNKSYEDIIKAQRNADPETAMIFFGAATRPRAVSFQYPLNEPGRVTIHIDFNNVNSFSELKRFLCRRIDEHKERLEKRRQRYSNKDYERLLTIGKKASDLYDTGKETYESLAAELLPETYKRKAGSATKTIEDLIRDYRRLRNGGYKELTHP